MSGVDGLASTLLASAATTQPIVLLHGFTGDSTLWESFAAALSAACAGSGVPRQSLGRSASEESAAGSVAARSPGPASSSGSPSHAPLPAARSAARAAARAQDA